MEFDSHVIKSINDIRLLKGIEPLGTMPIGKDKAIIECLRCAYRENSFYVLTKGRGTYS